MKALYNAAGPISIRELANITGIDEDSISQYYEPYLNRINFIHVSSKGRYLTSRGNIFMEDKYAYRKSRTAA